MRFTNTRRAWPLWCRASLAIFVAHTIASAGMRISLQHVLHVDDVAILVVLGTAIGVLAPLLLCASAHAWAGRCSSGRNAAR